MRLAVLLISDSAVNLMIVRPSFGWGGLPFPRSDPRACGPLIKEFVSCGGPEMDTNSLINGGGVARRGGPDGVGVIGGERRAVLPLAPVIMRLAVLSISETAVNFMIDPEREG
ncbi:hypothetical protein BAW75_30925 [Micromonospora chalcea]|nr:hypothetical protein BAW75_30925 [Micromonospora chalcea]